MKKVYFIAVLIIATVLISPKFIGSVVETERSKALTELNKVEGLTLITRDYETRWFGGTVNSELILSPLAQGGSPITLLLEEELSFGPVIFTGEKLQLGLGHSALTFTLLSNDVDDELLKLINEKIHISALLGLNKAVTTFVNIDALKYQNAGNSIESAPSQIEVTFRDNKHMIGDLSWGGLELNEEGEKISIGELTMSTEQTVVSGDYFAGTAILAGHAEFNLAEANRYSQNMHVFSLSDAGVKSEVSLDNDLLALTMKYYAQEISASGQNFQQPNLDIHLANVDINAIQKLNDTMNDLSMNAVNNGNSDQILRVLSEVVEKILVQEPSLKVTDLSVLTDEGKVQTQMNFSLNKDLIDTNNLNQMSLIMALEADAKGMVPLPLLTKFGVAPVASNFVEQGYLTQQENDILFDAEYLNSQLTLNGKVLQL